MMVKNAVSVENNWLHLFCAETGYEVYLRTFLIEGKRQTVAVDNFSVNPISVLDYDLDDVNLDLVEWGNVWDKPIFRYQRYNEGLNELKVKLNQKDYQEVENLYEENFS